MNKQFKVGDRVVINNNFHTEEHVGTKATVVGTEVYIRCVFDGDDSKYQWCLLPRELDFEYTLHNRHSDMICWVMENEEVGSWYGKLGKHTNEAIPFPPVYRLFLRHGEKEIFFSLMWMVDDETLDALIEEMKGG